MWEAPSFDQLQDAIGDPSNPIGMRMRAAYFLKQAYMNHHHNSNNHNTNNNDGDTTTTNKKKNGGGSQEEIIACLAKGLIDERHGSLMRHEYAYVMGQLGDPRVRIVSYSTVAIALVLLLLLVVVAVVVAAVLGNQK